MITFSREPSVSVYVNVDDEVCIKHDDLLSGNESIICMSKARAIELSKALRKVANEVE